MPKIHHIKYYHHLFGIRGLIASLKGKVTGDPILLEMKRPKIKYPFYLRFPSSDIPAFGQIFKNLEYNFDVQKVPKVILDAGANIGLASIYFANKYPDAKIIAIEPEENNYEILKKNIASYNNIIPVLGALWHENTNAILTDPGLGEWGFITQTEENIDKSRNNIIQEVTCVTVNKVMEDYGLDHIDIFKIDIEGAEREVFSSSTSWINQVDTLIIELHEHLKIGCNHSFYNATNNFDDEWLQGENIYMTRDRGCKISPHSQ